MEPVLKFVNVNKYYNNNVHALHNINLEIAAGEFISVIGPSGSGKSTLLRTVNRLIDVSDGEICLDGENITSIGGKKLRAVRRKVGMIFQNYNLVYRLSVLQNVLHGYLGYLDGIKGILGIYPEEEKLRAISLLEEMGLGAFCYNRAADLSGGQKQRVGIARALAVNPEFIVCDEPISALDVSIQSQVVNMLEDMQQELGLTYLFIAHDLSVVRHISHRIGVMYLGTMVELAESYELNRNPLHPYTKTLLSAVPVPDPQVSKNRQRIVLEGDIPSPMNPPSGCRFHTRCPYATERCKQEVPKFKEYEKEHWVACHLLER